MWQRGETFWQWADPTLHHRTHVEALEGGNTIDVQVRLSRTGTTQLFIGIYAPQGQMLFEEAFDSRPGETMTRTLLWGVSKAKAINETNLDSRMPKAYVAGKTSGYGDA